MDLSSELISQFAKITNDNKKEKTESTVYGTTVELDGRIYVKLDGSDRLTPVETTTAVAGDERVMVTIKDHSATITGNISSPAAKDNEVKELGNKIDEFDTIVADKVKAETAEIETAIITKLDGKYATFESLDATYASIKSLEAAEGEIGELKADNVDIKEKLTARDAEINQLKANSLTVEVADAKYATIDELEATTGEFNSLKSTYGEFVDLTTDKFEAIEGTIADLDVESLNAKYANIDFSNIGKAAMENFYANSGLIKDVVVGDQTITGELVGVTIRGDRIIGGSIIADKLVIKGDDGIYYKLNAEGGATAEQLATEEYQNGLHGSNIITNSITAEKIKVDDLVAFDATIGNFNIGDNSIYSGAKASVDNTTRGIYMDTDGQLNFGDSNNYLKFYKDQNGNYKLDISASSLKFGTGGQTVEDAITSIQNSVDNIQVGGRNLILNTSTDYIVDATNNTSTFYNLIVYSALEVGETYTFSAEITVEGTTDQTISAVLYNYSTYTGGETGYMIADGTRQSFTFTVTTDTPLLLLYAGMAGNTAGVKATYRHMKLEKGTVATDWTPAPEDVDANIAGIQVGGRNLFKSTNKYVSNAYYDIATYAPAGEPLVEGETYTMSMCVTPAADVTHFAPHISVGMSSIGEMYVKNGTNKQILSYTFICHYYPNQTPSQNLEFAKLTVYRYPHPQELANPGNTTIHWIKVEKGNRATDWSPAPEDVEAKITENKASIQVLNDKIASNVTETNSLKTKMSTVEQTASSLSSRVTSTENSISNLKVSDRNLILNSGIPISSNDYLVARYTLSENWVVGETYTLIIKGQHSRSYFGLYRDSGWVNVGNAATYADSNYTTSITFVCPAHSLEGGVPLNVLTVYNIPDTQEAKSANIEWIKLVKGNVKLTDWSPAPEDVTAAIDSVQVGNRNYIRNSNAFNWSGACGPGITYSISDGVWKIVVDSYNENWHAWYPPNTIEENFKTGDEFTFSIEIKCDSGSTGEPSIYFKDGMGYYDMKGTVSTEYSTLYYTGKWSDINDIQFHFGWAGSVGTFYIRSVKFERGNRATDWSPAPEDIEADITSVQTGVDSNAQKIVEAESNIEQLSNQLSSLVRDGSGKSLMTQTSTGWTFSMGDFEAALNNLLSHVKIGTYNGQPCLELVVDDTKQKLMLTNTEIRFMESDTTAAYVSGNTMNIDHAQIDNGLSIGSGYNWAEDSDDILNLIYQ